MLARRTKIVCTIGPASETREALEQLVAFSPNETTLRKLSLYWGVLPRHIEQLKDTESMVDRANDFVIANGLGSPGDKIVAVFGALAGVAGGSNSIRVRVLE